MILKIKINNCYPKQQNPNVFLFEKNENETINYFN